MWDRRCRHADDFSRRHVRRYDNRRYAQAVAVESKSVGPARIIRRYG